MTISIEEAKNLGLRQVTEWRSRNASARAGFKESTYLDFLCREVLRLSEKGVEAEVVHGPPRSDNLVCLYRDKEGDYKPWRKTL